MGKYFRYTWKLLYLGFQSCLIIWKRFHISAVSRTVRVPTSRKGTYAKIGILKKTLFEAYWSPYWLVVNGWIFPMVQWSNGPMDQWSNGPMVQWTNGPMDHWSNQPMIQWSNGPMDRTLTQCSVAISRMDGIGMGYIMSTGIGFFSF